MDIALRAAGHIGSTAWARDMIKMSIDGRFTFRTGEHNCSLFVYDVIHQVIGEAPHNAWHPHTAADWASSEIIDNWKNMGNSETWQPGDVIAMKIDGNNATGHCGIAVSNYEVVAVDTLRVSLGTHGLTGGVVRRYTGH